MKIIFGLVAILALSACTSDDAFTLYVPKGASMKHCTVEHHPDGGILIQGCEMVSGGLIYPGAVLPNTLSDAGY
jgi:hypothetical protein